MARKSRNDLPRYLELHPLNRAYYYKNPAMARKANLGKDRRAAIDLAKSLNAKYRLRLEQEAVRLEARVDHGGPTFARAFDEFLAKYIEDYRLKASTTQLLRQREKRLAADLGRLQVAAIDTQVLRECVAHSSRFEQTKLRSLLRRFFSYAKSTGLYPSHLPNPVDDLFVDPPLPKQRQRMTIAQFKAIHDAAPQWLRWLMVLGLHLALRRVDLVNLRFDDVVGDRIISPIRKTDSKARDMESTSVDFPVHPDVRIVLAQARRSSLRVGRCPFIVHREPQRRTKRSADALLAGRMEHPAQILPQYASKAFNKARSRASRRTDLFAGLTIRQMPTLHEVRALSSHLYAKAGYDVSVVQDLMAHTDPDMTRAYQKGHARKVLRIEMMLPYSVLDDEDSVREPRGCYLHARPSTPKGLRENSLRIL